MIRTATTDDIPRIAEIQIGGWRYAYRGLLSDHELFSERLVVRAVKATAARLEAGCEFVVFDDLADGVVKGFAWHGRCRDDDAADSYEINAIYVQPEFCRGGIGGSMLGFVADYARARGYGELIVWVLDGNAKGLGFYEKHGFIADGKRKLIEKWGREEIRMVKRL